MIKLEIQLALRDAACATNNALLQIYALHIGFDKLYVTKNSPERIDDVARIKISSGDLMQHRRKENEILATDQRHLYVRSTREPFLEVHCRVKPGKSATGNDYFSRLHAVTSSGTFSSEPETDQQNQDKRGQNGPRDHDDFDSQFARGRNVVVDVRIAVKESVAVAKNIPTS